MTIDFEQATINDIPLVLNWTSQLFDHEDDGKLETSDNFITNLEKWLINLVQSDNSITLIAKKSNTPVGLIIASSVINDNGFLKQPLKGVIQVIWVPKEFRNQGIGYLLLEKVEQCFEHVGIHYVECTFISQNKEAKGFWNRAGFKTFSETARKFIGNTPT